jgi:hypothetical protein
MRYVFLAAILIPASLFGQASQTGWVLYDDFSQGLRPNNNTNDPVGLLWQPTTGNCFNYGCNPNQAVGDPTKQYLEDTISAPYNASTGWAGYYFRNEPYGAGSYYNVPYYTKYYMMTGYNWPNVPSGWNPNFTDMRFKFRCSADIPNNPSQGYVQTLGTYIKNPTTIDTSSDQGLHYYHYGNYSLYANQWIYLDYNSTPSHLVTDSSNPNYPNDPGWNGTSGYHYWDGMMHWYLSTESDWPASGGPWTCDMGAVYFKQKTGEAPDWVPAQTITYNPNATRWEVSWYGPKNGVVTYQIMYSTAGSLRAAGFSTGTSGGTVSTPGTGYGNTYWNSPTTTASNMWVAIRPIMPVTSVSGGGGSPVQITTFVGHGLATGDAVNVAGVCTGANGNQTVTVVDRTHFTLNGTSAACTYSGTGGTVTATSDTTNFAEIFTGDPGGSTLSSNACDLNGDGIVNNTDVQMAVNMSLGVTACSMNINGSGVCNVVGVQRVINASMGSACKVGP